VVFTPTYIGRVEPNMHTPLWCFSAYWQRCSLALKSSKISKNEASPQIIKTMLMDIVHLQWFIFMWLVNRCVIIFSFIFGGHGLLGEISPLSSNLRVK
jgi:hypothetical protein